MSTRRRLAGAVVGVASIAAAFVAWPAPSGAANVRGIAELRNAALEPIGTVTFLGHGAHATSVRVQLTLPEGAPGLGDFHGLHVHANGVCEGTFGSAGLHWAASSSQLHGSHLGDLPSVLVGLDGTADMTVATSRIEVGGLAGRAVILHAGRDNFNNIPEGAGAEQYTPNSADAETLTDNTGNAGMRYGCGVVELAGG
jgi:Cu-Zn family superoxide dismutase